MIGRLVVLLDRRMPRGAVAGIAVLVAFSLVLALPLRLVAGAVPGLSAREAEGSVWHGVLREARIGPFAADTLEVHLRPLPLLAGKLELAIATRSLEASWAFKGKVGPTGLADLDGTLPLAGGLSGLPIDSASFSEFGAVFDANGCQRAGGMLSISVAIPGSTKLDLSGSAHCSGRDLVIPLRGAGGMERLDLRILPDGRWQGDLAVAGISGEVQAQLAKSGFAARPGSTDMVMRASGKF